MRLPSYTREIERSDGRRSEFRSEILSVWCSIDVDLSERRENVLGESHAVQMYLLTGTPCKCTC